ncbi:MAG TPA: glycosyltransferase [Candidatus Eremiobacteraceae bacterium]|nr:glycosyltransferase [Candidatus Eremiobacteraceae bacterium]
MKILFLSRQLNIGGAERQLVTLANELAARGHEIVIASYYPGGALSQMLDPKRIKLISYEKKSRWDLFTLFFKTLKVVRDEQPTVLHGWMHTQNVVATFAKALNPKVTMVWAVRASNLEEHLDWAEKLTIWLQARLSIFASRIAVNSMAGLEYAVKSGLPREKMLFVPNGIDTNTFYPNDEERRRVRAQWNMGDDVKIVGNISRFDPIKNHTMFLKAAAGVAAERSDVRFICVGHGKESYLQELKQLARTLGLEGKVHWIQAQSEVRAVYNALDVFCSSSLTEGFPNVIGEAMACGRHCVVTNVGDSALVVGDTGVVVPSDDAKAMSAGLLDRINTTETLNLRARQRILENFTVAHLADKSEYVLYQAIEQSHPNLGHTEEIARSADA